MDVFINHHTVNMKLLEYIKPDTRTVGFLVKRCVLSNSPGTTNEKIVENEESVGDDEEFNW